MQSPKTTIKLNPDSFIAVCFFISFMVPYISYKGHGYVLPFIIFFVWLVSVVFKKDYFYKILQTLAFRKLELFCLFAFLLVTLFTYFYITPTIKAFQYTLMPITYFFIIVMDAYYFRRDPRFKFSIFFVVTIILGVQAAISIPYMLASENMVSRMYTSGALQGDALEEAFKNGVGSVNLYSNLCGVFFFSIGMLTKISNNVKLKIIIVISMTLILFSILSSSYLLPILMLLAGGVVFLLRLNWKRIKPAYIFTLVLLFAGLIIFYNSFLNNSEIIEPIENKIEHITRGDLKEDGRIELAAVSLNTFSEHPFFGVGVPDWGSHTQIGEHMPWIDFLAHYGFFGFLPVLLFLILLFKRNYRFYLKSPKNNIYATACLIGFVIFILSNVIDPLIFDAPMIIMLLFFYTSIFNWSNKSTANPFLS